MNEFSLVCILIQKLMRFIILLLIKISCKKIRIVCFEYLGEFVRLKGVNQSICVLSKIVIIRF